MTDRKPRVLLLEAEIRTSERTGRQWYSAWLGKARLVGFEANELNDRGHKVIRFFAEEPEPDQAAVRGRRALASTVMAIASGPAARVPVRTAIGPQMTPSRATAAASSTMKFRFDGGADEQAFPGAQPARRPPQLHPGRLPADVPRR